MLDLQHGFRLPHRDVERVTGHQVDEIGILGAVIADKNPHTPKLDGGGVNYAVGCGDSAGCVTLSADANVVTIEETSHGVGYLTITSSDTTRLATTDEGAPLVESLAAVPGIGGTFDT